MSITVITPKGLNFYYNEFQNFGDKFLSVSPEIYSKQNIDSIRDYLRNNYDSNDESKFVSEKLPSMEEPFKTMIETIVDMYAIFGRYANYGIKWAIRGHLKIFDRAMKHLELIQKEISKNNGTFLLDLLPNTLGERCRSEIKRDFEEGYLKVEK